jgi:hypothetical protein
MENKKKPLLFKFQIDKGLLNPRGQTAIEKYLEMKLEESEIEKKKEK